MLCLSVRATQGAARRAPQGHALDTAHAVLAQLQGRIARVSTAAASSASSTTRHVELAEVNMDLVERDARYDSQHHSHTSAQESDRM